MNLDSFQITSAVVHDIPHGGDQDQPLVLTDAPITLDDALSAYFRKKIIKSLGLWGLEVVVDPDGAATSPTGSAFDPRTRPNLEWTSTTPSNASAAAEVDPRHHGRAPPRPACTSLAARR